MSGNYEHDQERLVSTAGQAIQTAVSVGVQLWMARTKPVKIQVQTAATDVKNVRQGLNSGKSEQELLTAVQKGEIYQRLARSGGEADKYAQLVVRRAEIDQAVEIMPSQAPTQTRIPKKSL